MALDPTGNPLRLEPMFRKRPSPDPAPVSDAPAAQIVDAFHRLYYDHNDGATT